VHLHRQCITDAKSVQGTSVFFNLSWLVVFMRRSFSIKGGFPYRLSAKSPNPDAFTHLLSGGENTEHYVDLYAVSSVCQYRFLLPVLALTKQPPVSIFPLNASRHQAVVTVNVSLLFEA